MSHFPPTHYDFQNIVMQNELTDSFMITLHCVYFFLHSYFPSLIPDVCSFSGLFPLFPQWQLLSLFIFSQGLLLFLSVAFSASLTCSLWLTLSHLHHFHFTTCTKSFRFQGSWISLTVSFLQIAAFFATFLLLFFSSCLGFLSLTTAVSGCNGAFARIFE